MRLTAALTIITLLSLSIRPVSPTYGCYAIIVGRGASADGSVLVGHNEQNGGRRILNFRRIPRQQFAGDAVVELRRGGRLDQANGTAAFLWSENPGLEFSDAYLNQWGVAVVSDGCPTREDDYAALVARGEIRQGGIGYMLRRLVAQRARTAREGVELAGRLVERFGYADSGRTYVIADPREAWLLAVVRGRRWVAQRVPDDAVVVLPNIHIIGEVDLADTDNFLASADLIDYAVRRGWFDPDGGEAFNFRKVYRRDRSDAPDARRWWGRQLVSGRRVAWPPAEPPPVGIEPKQKMTVASVAAILRDTAGPGRVPSALKAVRKGGVVVCGGIHMSDIPSFPYDILWEERAVRSVANLTRDDAREFLALAPAIPVKTTVVPMKLSQANEALEALRQGKLTGAAVLIP